MLDNKLYLEDIENLIQSIGNFDFIKNKSVFISGASGTKTVRNNFFNVESCIDHIVLSPSARDFLGKDTEIIYDNSRVGRYSDHTLLCLCS